MEVRRKAKKPKQVSDVTKGVMEQRAFDFWFILNVQLVLYCCEIRLGL